jgi:uracil phosphoribosyltransferase
VRGVTVVEHPVLAHRLAALRDQLTDRDHFRRLVSEISRFLAYEGLRDLGTEEILIDTPVADAVTARRVNEHVLVVPVLRAGLGMVQAVQEVLPWPRWPMSVCGATRQPCRRTCTSIDFRVI